MLQTNDDQSLVFPPTYSAVLGQGHAFRVILPPSGGLLKSMSCGASPFSTHSTSFSKECGTCGVDLWLIVPSQCPPPAYC